MRIRICLSTILTTLVIGPAALADSTTRQHVTVQTVTGLKVLAVDSEIITRVSGDKSSITTKATPQSKIVRTFGGGGTTMDIILLNEEKSIYADLDKNEHMEISFADQRARLDAGLEQIDQLQAQGQREGEGGADTGLPVEEERCEWQKAEATAITADEKKMVGTFQTEETTYTFTQTCLDKETGKSCDFRWTVVQNMLANAPGAEEMLAFQRNYAQAMGMDDFASETQRTGMAALFASFRAGWDDIMEKAASQEGYPVKTVFEAEVGGEQCTFASGQSISSENIFGDAAQAGMEAGANQAAYDSAAVAGQQAAEAAGGGTIMGRAAGSAAGTFGRKLAGGLMGKFRKQPEAEPETTAEESPTDTEGPVEGPVEGPDEGPLAANAPDGMISMFLVTIMTDSFSTDPIPLTAFAPPEGSKLVPAPKIPTTQ